MNFLTLVRIMLFFRFYSIKTMRVEKEKNIFLQYLETHLQQLPAIFAFKANIFIFRLHVVFFFISAIVLRFFLFFLFGFRSTDYIQKESSESWKIDGALGA